MKFQACQTFYKIASKGHYVVTVLTEGDVCN